MNKFEALKERFQVKCTACGTCADCCSIIPLTDLKDTPGSEIMRAVHDLFCTGKITDTARTRILSCMFCNACRSQCPEGLDPALIHTLGREVLVEQGDILPPACDSIVEAFTGLMGNAIESLQAESGDLEWITIDVKKRKRQKAKTVLMSSCFGLVQTDELKDAMEIVRRIDSAVHAVGGVDYCCGELYLAEGNSKKAMAQFDKLMEALSAFSPEKVVTICTHCQKRMDFHNPDVPWSWQFITDYIVDHLPELGPLNELKQTVTLHDACCLTRGYKPASDSPRKILNAIPGIRMVEMENCRENTLCCSAGSIGAVGKPAIDLRDQRLSQASNTGADVLAVCCPICLRNFTSEGAEFSARIESLITILAESMGAPIFN